MARKRLANSLSSIYAQKLIMQYEISWVNATHFHKQPLVATLPSLLTKTACICLQSTTCASLEWKEEIKIAEKYVADGYKLLWDMQFGLFDQLKAPLSSSMQLQALQLALDQFQTIIWEKFAHHSAGMILFRGPLNLTAQFPWDKMQESNFAEWLPTTSYPKQNIVDLSTAERKRLSSYFCLDVATEYLQLLSAHLPPMAKAYVLLEIDAEISMLDEALMLNQERFGWLQPIGIHAKLPQATSEAKVGICLPPLEASLSPKSNLLANLLMQLSPMNYRLIPEEQITSLWSGLDVLLVQAGGISLPTKRKLQGFMAAGGQLVTYGGSLLGLPDELSLEQWLDT